MLECPRGGLGGRFGARVAESFRAHQPISDLRCEGNEETGQKQAENYEFDGQPVRAIRRSSPSAKREEQRHGAQERGKSDRRKGSSESTEHGRRARRVIPSPGVEKVESPVLLSVLPEVPAEPVAAREREPPHRVERRSSVERRGGDERRQAIAAGLAARVIRSIERRESVERRSGVDRREPRKRLKAREARLRRAARRQGLVLRKSRHAYGYILGRCVRCGHVAVGQARQARF
jgi:hypothetical protein